MTARVDAGRLEQSYDAFPRIEEAFHAALEESLLPRGRMRLLRRVVRRYEVRFVDRLEPREADWLWRTIGVVPTSADPARTTAAIAVAGLQIDDVIDLGTEWGEWQEEQSAKSGRRLLYAARLVRDPQG